MGPGHNLWTLVHIFGTSLRSHPESIPSPCLCWSKVSDTKGMHHLLPSMDTFNTTYISYLSSHFIHTVQFFQLLLIYISNLIHSPQLSTHNCVWSEVRLSSITVFTSTYFVCAVPCAVPKLYVHRYHKYSCLHITMSDLSALYIHILTTRNCNLKLHPSHKWNIEALLACHLGLHPKCMIDLNLHWRSSGQLKAKVAY